MKFTGKNKPEENKFKRKSSAKEGKSLHECAYHNKKICLEKQYTFNEFFKLSLKTFLTEDIASLITGFDIVKFDEAIKTPDGISTKNYIIKKYGEKASELISWLISNTGPQDD